MLWMLISISFQLKFTLLTLFSLFSDRHHCTETGILQWRFCKHSTGVSEWRFCKHATGVSMLFEWRHRRLPRIIEQRRSTSGCQPWSVRGRQRCRTIRGRRKWRTIRSKDPKTPLIINFNYKFFCFKFIIKHKNTSLFCC